jgi:hypothetical protein
MATWYGIWFCPVCDMPHSVSMAAEAAHCPACGAIVLLTPTGEGDAFSAFFAGCFVDVTTPAEEANGENRA